MSALEEYRQAYIDREESYTDMWACIDKGHAAIAELELDLELAEDELGGYKNLVSEYMQRAEEANAEVARLRYIYDRMNEYNTWQLSEWLQDYDIMKESEGDRVE